MVRFDSKALYKALNAKREQQRLTWKQVSTEIGVAESTIKRTENGGRMEVDGVLAMVAWLGVPVETFVRQSNFNL